MTRETVRSVLLSLILVVAGCGAAGGEDENRPLAGAGTERAMGTPGAHEHGVARMNVAVEDEHVFLELFVPGHSVYGFEGAPRNDAQRAALAEGERTLRERAPELVRFSAGAECRVEDVRLAGRAEPHDAGGDPDAGTPAQGEDQGHGHTHTHAHDHDDDHPDDHDHAHEGGHSDVQVEAVIRCARPPSGLIMGVDVNRVLPDVEWVDLQVVGARQQFGARVPAAGYEVRL
jgi:hypothetical protein